MKREDLPKDIEMLQDMVINLSDWLAAMNRGFSLKVEECESLRVAVKPKTKFIDANGVPVNIDGVY